MSILFVFLFFLLFPNFTEGRTIEEEIDPARHLNTGVDYSAYIGSWKGKLKIGYHELNILFHITLNDTGEPLCSLDSPDQGARNIPAEISIFPSDSLNIHIPSLTAAFSGKLSDEKIIGTFYQAGLELDLTLSPGELIRKRPQTPVPPFPYATKEISFRNEEAQATLSGTLTYPVGYSVATSSQTPVVLMVTGSGLQDRNEEIMEHKPFAVIADYLARHGIASLRYDDRTFGKSTGENRNATSYDFMTDALAGIAYLRDYEVFGKIGIIGHSEGGIIAFMLAQQDRPDFIITLASPGISGADILMEQNRISLIGNGMNPDEVKDYCKIFQKVMNEKKLHGIHQHAERFITELIEKESIEMVHELKANLIAFLQMETPWLDYFISFSPVNVIRHTKCPVMALNGEKDVQINAKTNLESIRRHLPHHPDHVIREYPDLNHLFQHCETGNVTEYGDIEETISPEVLSDMTAWIKQVCSRQN